MMANQQNEELFDLLSGEIRQALNCEEIEPDLWVFLMDLIRDLEKNKKLFYRRFKNE